MSNVNEDTFSCHSFSVKQNKLKNVKTRTWIAYIFAVLAAFSGSFGGLFIKMTQGDRMQTVLIRFLAQYIMLLPVATYKRRDVELNNWKVTTLLWIHGFVVLASMMTFTHAFDYLSLGDAMAILYTFPAFVVLFACIFLKEKCSIIGSLLTTLTLVGVVLIAEPSFIFGVSNSQIMKNPSSRIIGISLALLASLSVSITAIIVRYIGTNVHFSVTLIYCSIVGCIVMPIYFVLTDTLEFPCLKDLPTLLAGSLSMVLAQIFAILALQRERAGPISLVLTSQVIISFVIQYVALGAKPSLFGAMGASLIMLCAAITSVANIYKEYKNKGS